MGVPVVVIDNELERWQVFGRANTFPWFSASSLNDGRVDSLYSACITHTIAILPPLPRRPKPEDATLLYRYCSEGINVCGKYLSWYDDDECSFGRDFIIKEGPIVSFLGGDLVREITHATDTNGNRIEIAIEGE